MRKMFAFLQFLLLLSISVILFVSGDDTLRFAKDDLSDFQGTIVYSSVFVRHGDRAPILHYKTREESYWSSHWPQGIGNISEMGKLQEYNLGKWFGKRYNSLLTENNVTKENADQWVIMDSSNVDRTIISAKCFLHGFFSPSENGQCSDEVLQNKPPVEINLKQMIIFNDAGCKRYNSEREIVNASLQLGNFYSNNERIFNAIAEKIETRFSSENKDEAIEKGYLLYDTFFIEESYNLELQDWAKAIYPEPLKQIAIQHVLVNVYNFKMKKLRSGPLIGEVIQNMLSKIQNERSPILHFYSGHDSTITGLLESMGVFDRILPQYGASLFFELRLKAATHVITILYRDKISSEPRLLKIPGCGNVCTFENFKRLVDDLVPKNWEDECNEKW